MNRLLRFKYTNWKGEEHTYLVRPETNLELGLYNAEYPGEPMHWYIHGWVLKRDDEERGNRRTFELRKMRDIVELEG